MFSRIYIHALVCSTLVAFYVHARCFTKFEKNGKRFCACGSSFESSRFSMFSSVEALMLCSMRCSQASSCVAYNFFAASNHCHLFNRTMKTFAVILNCQYYFKKASIANQTLLITADDELTEFYVNGNSVPFSLNFPNAKYWWVHDTYKLTGAIHVLATKSFNVPKGPGGLLARTSDNYTLTNSSWKCTNNSYDGWYEMDYDDSFWPDAVVAKKKENLNHSVPVIRPAFWIIDSSDYSGDYYCRKNFTEFVPGVKCDLDKINP